jgi:hypothetical protein
MFWGEPYCDSCGYVGPDFMWTWHHGIGIGVLVQHATSRELRVIDIADSSEFYGQDGQTDEERSASSRSYIDTIVEKEIRHGEEQIDASRIWKWEFESHGKSDILCPKCSQLLLWRGTGIS